MKSPLTLLYSQGPSSFQTCPNTGKKTRFQASSGCYPCNYSWQLVRYWQSNRSVAWQICRMDSEATMQCFSSFPAPMSLAIQALMAWAWTLSISSLINSPSLRVHRAFHETTPPVVPYLYFGLSFEGVAVAITARAASISVHFRYQVTEQHWHNWLQPCSDAELVGPSRLVRQYQTRLRCTQAWLCQK